MCHDNISLYIKGKIAAEEGAGSLVEGKVKVVYDFPTPPTLFL
jgi:hypothetical protein